MTEHQIVDPHNLIGEVTTSFSQMYDQFKEFANQLQELHDHPALSTDPEALLGIRQFLHAAAISLEMAYYALGDTHTSLHYIHSLVYRGYEPEEIERANREIDRRVTRFTYIGKLHSQPVEAEHESATA